MDQSNLPSHSGIDKSVKSNDDKQFSLLDPSKQIKTNFTMDSANLLLCLQAVQSLNKASPEQTTVESTSDASKSNEVRKKGRPPKPEGQPPDDFRCHVCGKAFSSSSSLAKHRITHNEERRFVCPVCSKTFKRNDHLTGHRLTHSDEKPFSCDKCDKSYCDSRSLKRHVDQYHPDATGRVRADDTGDDNNNGEEFPSSLSADSSSSQLHPCRTCGRTFKNLQALNGHMRHHAANAPKKMGDTQAAIPQDEKCTSLTTLGLTPSSQQVGNSSSDGLLLSRANVPRKVADSGTSLPSILLSHAVDPKGQTSLPSYGASGLAPRPLELGTCLPGPDGTEGRVLLLNDSNGSQAFLLRPGSVATLDGRPASYSFQLQHLAQQVQPGLLWHLQQQQLKKVSDGAVSGQPPASHSLLHSLLSKGSDAGAENSPRSVPVVAETTAADEHFELLGNYSEGVNFDDIDGLLGHSGIGEGQGSRGDLAKEGEEEGEDDGTACEDPSMETSIPEDLRNIPTHALQMFSIASASSGKPGIPTLEGNEVMADVGTDDLLDRDFTPEYHVEDDDPMIGEEVKALVAEALAGETLAGRAAGWNLSQALSGEILEKILDIPKGDRDFKGSDRVPSEETSEGEGRTVPEERSTESQSPPRLESSLPLPKKTQRPEKFRNPGLLKIKRPHWPGPLIIPPSPSDPPSVGGQRESGDSGNSNFAFQSRLRSPRIIPGSGSFDSSIPPPFNLPFVPYTPPPMLSPVRNASGLFCLIQAVIATQTPPLGKTKKLGGSTSPDLYEGLVEEVVTEESTPNEPPATDIKPHINEGAEYQAEIPDLEGDRSKASLAGDHAEMVWDPKVLDGVPESEVRAFMEFSSCAAVPYNGCNRELAHHVLHLCMGDVKKACLAIMTIQPLKTSGGRTEDPYKYSETSAWDSAEIERFSQSVVKNGKDFFVVSREVGTKTCKECIELYYVWKKVCSQESIRLKAARRRNDNVYNGLRSRAVQQLPDIPIGAAEDLLELRHPTGFPERRQQGPAEHREDIQSFPFPLLLSPEISQHQQQRPSQNAPARRPSKQPRGGAKSAKHRPKPPRPPVVVVSPDANLTFPCKICKKVFYKVKSRSAHMKTHRMQQHQQQQQQQQPGSRKVGQTSPFVYEYRGSTQPAFD